ncbi:MAG: hypothetical protein JW896_07315 [Deltaproteobacteria bacterium]|nr:hypothetical protein [Deltaproteobacteria bacterium]
MEEQDVDNHILQGEKEAWDILSAALKGYSRLSQRIERDQKLKCKKIDRMEPHRFTRGAPYVDWIRRLKLGETIYHPSFKAPPNVKPVWPCIDDDQAKMDN